MYLTTLAMCSETKMLQFNSVADAKPVLVKYEKGDGMYDRDSTYLFCAKLILEEKYFYKRAKNMTDDLNKATGLTKECVKTFNFALEELFEKEKEISESSKRVSGNIRKSANELSEGLVKLEKTVNFNNLERYVGLLERAATTLETLAKLEKSGDLTKIIGALK